MTEIFEETEDLSDQEFLRIIRFLEGVRRPFEELPVSGQVDASWNIISYLVKCQVQGTPVTISTLIEVAKLPYGTAQRRIHVLIEEGKIEKVYRSTSKKSFYLVPSPETLEEFKNYIRDMKSLLAQTVGARHDKAPDEYYFGGADFAREIMPPAPLQSKLAENKEQLRFLLQDDNYFQAMRNMWADYRNNLASRKSFTLKPLPELHSALKKNLSMATPEFDVAAVNMPWLGEFAEKGQLMPLDDFIAEDDLRPMDFHPAVWSSGQWNDRQYGIPIYLTVEMMALRKDLFAEKGLAHPRTFDEVIDVGRQLNQPENEFYGIAWNGARGMPMASTFMILMGCAGRPIFNLPRSRRYYQWAQLTGEQLRPSIDCDEARVVLDYLQRLVEISPPDVLKMDWNRRVGAFLNGEVAMAYCWSMRAARFDQDVGSVVKRRVAFVPQPKANFGMSGNPIGGFLMTIPANLPEDRAKLAYEAVSWMTSPEAMKQHVTNGLPVAPRFSVAADPEAAASSPVVRFVDKLAQRGMLCTWQRPPVPEYRDIEFVLGNRIHSALTRELSVDEALSLAQTEADQIMRNAGRY